MARTTKPEKRKKTIPYNFGDKHKAYIRKSQDCMINVAEGAVCCICTDYSFGTEIFSLEEEKRK